MRSAEKAAFGRGGEVEALRDQAGAGIAEAVAKFFPIPGTCIVFAGKGHNAGDALVAAQWLRRRGWRVEVRLAFKEDDCSELMRKKLESLRRKPTEISGTGPQESADLGITLVELWAETADQLSQAQNAIAAEAYLDSPSPIV